MAGLQGRDEKRESRGTGGETERERKKKGKTEVAPLLV